MVFRNDWVYISNNIRIFLKLESIHLEFGLSLGSISLPLNILHFSIF